MPPLKQKSLPEVSVVLTTFNRAKLLRRAIKSVLKQSFKNWELIIVDDGSTDETCQVVFRFMKKIEKIKYLKQKNLGHCLAKNTGIQISQGKYLTFLDSDDEYQKDHLKKRVDYLRKNKKIDLIHGKTKIIGDPYVLDRNNPTRLIHLDQCVVESNLFGKRDVFISLGGFKNLPFGEGVDFWERAAQNFNLRKVDFPTYLYYRNQKDSITKRLVAARKITKAK